MAGKSSVDYKKTINLPRTNFPMKADLIRREPEFRKKWEEMDLYGLIRKARAGAKKYILHDGPPYPTGDLHIGTGLNKILKDIVVKYKTMRGYDAPFLPGWDCHGLPIEHQVMKELGEKAKELSSAEIRQRCRDYAMKYVDLQRQQFQGLGVTGDWYKPYLTLDPKYEAGVIDVFARLVERGFVYRSLKPIHWCMRCETALAEAELEYQEDESPSIFVNFRMVDDVSHFFDGIGDEDVYIMIWTTTPWTLPANMAIALNREFNYCAVRYTNPKTGKREITILAENCAASVMHLIGVSDFERLGSVRGDKLENLRYRHVFADRTCPIVLADYVSLEDGTGCVHTAPGHGQEDYMTGLQYGLEIMSPVDSRGVFTDEAGEFAGMEIWKANDVITRKLDELGVLLHSETMTHSYPHCWRCKEPVIFRATEQWFINVDHNDLRKNALEIIKNKVKWVPPWGEIRISNMVSERPDWCISRQRAWGVPIPAFYCKKCRAVLLKKEVVEHVRDVFREEGADSWFRKDASAFIPEGTKCEKCGGTEFEKETDIFDVWFESGSSHHAVLQQYEGMEFPADLYLEGSDQHRGWFQLSLLPCVATQDCAPFRTVLTHGFVLDEKGEKMSKSRGNFISCADALAEFGGDILRLWTSSLDYKVDMNVSRDLIRRTGDSYRRIRNTFRYLLGLLNDFDPAQHSVPYKELLEIDKWALSRTQRLIEAVTRAYEEFQFHRVFQLIHNFCAVEMSAFYIDVLKDRTYTFAANSKERRAAQTAMHNILLTLVRLCAPVLVYTSDEVWWEIKHKDEDVPSVHLAHWPEVKTEWLDDELEKRWERLLEVRTDVARELEKLRKAGDIGSSLDARVALCAKDDRLRAFLEEYREQLPTIFIVSEVELLPEPEDGSVAGVLLPSLQIKVEPSKLPKCERCWNRRDSVGKHPDHPTLCSRCVAVVQEMDG